MYDEQWRKLLHGMMDSEAIKLQDEGDFGVRVFEVW
jgi:hypothetical protein